MFWGVKKNWWFLAAALLSLATFAVHLFVGGTEAARPLLAAETVDEIARFTLYYAWHIVSITILAMALAFGLLALMPTRDRLLGWFVTGGAFAFAALDLFIIARFSLSAVTFGQWIAFALIGVLGIGGMRARA